VNPVFILGLGLAAIDGLTSAFVAMLVLAIIVIGSGAQGTPPDVSETAVLFIKKPPIRLLVSVAPDTAKPALLVPRQGFNDEQLAMLKPYTKNGRVEWVDCDNCRAQLLIIRPINVGWHLCLAYANTPGNFTESAPGAIELELELRTVTRTGKSAPLRTKEIFKIGDLWHGFQFNPTTNDAVQKVDDSRCSPT
jgi:hypothetical protein